MTTADSLGETMRPRTADSPAAPVRGQPPWLILAVVATFLPFLWKAVSYAFLGSMVPLGTFVLLGSITVIGLYLRGSWRRRAIRLWCAAMIAWGVARLVLQVLIVATDLREAHLRSQVNPAFSLLAVGYIVAGVALWRASRSRPPSGGRRARD